MPSASRGTGLSSVGWVTAGGSVGEVGVGVAVAVGGRLGVAVGLAGVGVAVAVGGALDGSGSGGLLSPHAEASRTRVATAVTQSCFVDRNTVSF